MKMRWILVIGALLVAPAGAGAEGFPFLPGEQMDLSVAWLKIPTGRARISVGKAEGAVWPVILQARTDGIARIADVRQHLVAYWDSDTRLSRGLDLSAFEVGYRHTDRARFDRESGKATLTVQGKYFTQKTRDIPADAQDFLSAFMWLRLQPLRPGDRHLIPIVASDKNFTLEATVVGREAVEAPAGRFQTVKVQIRTAFEGKFETRRDSALWLSDDPRHVLVQADADFAIGSLVAKLDAYVPGSAELAHR
jgi:hypothetical protein